MQLPLALLALTLAAAGLAEGAEPVMAVDTFEPPYTPSVYCEEKTWVWGRFFDQATHPAWNFTLSIYNRTGCGSRCAIGDPGVRLIETLATDWLSTSYTWLVDVPIDQDIYFHVWDGVPTAAKSSQEGVHLSFPIPAWTVPTTHPCDQSRLTRPYDAASVQLPADTSASTRVASLRPALLLTGVAVILGPVVDWG